MQTIWENENLFYTVLSIVTSGNTQYPFNGYLKRS